MKPTTERNVDVQALIDNLSGVQIGGEITFDALSRAIGRDIRNAQNRPLLYRAFDVLIKEGAVFENIRGEGYKRMEAENIHAIGHSARRRIRRSARVAKAKISGVLKRSNDVPPEAHRRALAEMSNLGLLEHIAGTKFAKKLEREEAKAPMSSAETCRAFMQHIGAGPSAAPVPPAANDIGDLLNVATAIHGAPSATSIKEAFGK